MNNLSEMISGTDIYNFFEKNGYNSPTITTYKNLNLSSRLDNLINCMFLLYENMPNVGHWVLVFYDEVDNIIEFFDPYGMLIDDQLKYSYYAMKEPMLTKKFLNMNYPIFEINDEQFQSYKSGINTCGKWCCIRYWAMKENISKKEFDDYFLSFPLDKRDQEMNEFYNTLSCSL